MEAVENKGKKRGDRKNTPGRGLRRAGGAEAVSTAGVPENRDLTFQRARTALAQDVARRVLAKPRPRAKSAAKGPTGRPDRLKSKQQEQEQARAGRLHQSVATTDEGRVWAEAGAPEGAVRRIKRSDGARGARQCGASRPRTSACSRTMPRSSSATGS